MMMIIIIVMITIGGGGEGVSYPNRWIKYRTDRSVVQSGHPKWEHQKKIVCIFMVKFGMVSCPPFSFFLLVVVIVVVVVVYMYNGPHHP